MIGTKKDVNNPNEYEYELQDYCITKGCHNIGCWHIDHIVWRCDNCMKEMELEKGRGDKE